MNVSVIGSKGLTKELGKKGTSSDMTLYNTSFQGKYFTFIEPDKYPEKVQTLFQAINMSHFSILFITKDLPKNVLGECILALDMLGKRGLIVLDGVNEGEIRSIVSNTSLKDFPILENNTAKIMELLYSLDVENIQRGLKVVLDHAFMVKSVGTVALGTVMSGEIKKHDNLVIYPAKKNVLVKSIQIHDKDYEKAGCGERVGLSLKGVEVEEIERGSMIGSNIQCIKELSISITKNKFFKDNPPANVMFVVGLQYVNGRLDGDKIIFNNESGIR